MTKISIKSKFEIRFRFRVAASRTARLPDGDLRLEGWRKFLCFSPTKLEVLTNEEPNALTSWKQCRHAAAQSP